MSPLDRVHQYLHANARLRMRDAVELGAATLYRSTAMDPADNLVLANRDEPDELAESLDEARRLVQEQGGRTHVRLIRELFPRISATIVPTGFRMVKQEPQFVCPLEQFLPAAPMPELSIVTLTSESPLDAIQEGLDVNERGFDPGFTDSATEEQATNYRSTLVTARAFTAHLNGEAVAGGMFHTPLDGVTQFSGITTLAPYRQRGIAAALTTFMTRKAFDSGVDLVYLAAANAPAQRVYKRLGFSPVGTLLVYEDALIR